MSPRIRERESWGRRAAREGRDGGATGCQHAVVPVTEGGEPSRLEVLLHQDAEAALYSMAMGGWGVETCLGAGSDNNFMEWLRERGRRPCAQGEELERREEPVL